MIPNLIFVIFFFEIFFRAYSFISRVPSSDHQIFFIPEFIAENIKPNKNQRKRSPILQYIFTQMTTLILRISTLLKLKIKCSQNKAKQNKLSQFTHFPTDMFLFGVRKNICIASFPDAQELLSSNNLKANVCMFLYISLTKFYFKVLARFYLMVWGRGRLEAE